ncbi:MAG: CD225/dispanin family protein [Thermoguttaceae bacterium]|nr:CD225/dispanin family protein [Thermoguttaceae bacterium]
MSDWFYYDASGVKQGPVNDAQLQALAQSGFITPETILQTAAGQTGKAGQVRGLFGAPTAPPYPTAPAASARGGSSAYCTNCGNPVEEQAVACMRCGASPVGHNKFCRRCGARLNPEQIVCVQCGAAVAPAPSGPNAYGAQNYGWQNYGGQNGGAMEIPNYLVWAILEALFCCLPFGVIAIVYAVGANSAKESGNYVQAQKKARSAKKWLIWGIVLGIITNLLIVFAQIAANSGGF